MTEALRGYVAIQVNMRLTNPLDLSTPKDDFKKTIQYSLATGTGDSQADRHWHDTRVVSGGLNDDIDLVGALTDGLGQTFSPNRIKSMTIKASASNSNPLLINNSVANAFFGPFQTLSTSGFAINPGGVFHFTDAASKAWPVSSGSDIFRVRNPNSPVSGANLSYDIMVTACSS